MGARTRRTAAALSVAALTVGLAAAGCTGKHAEPYRDAPVGTRNDAPANVITFPDGFGNVAAKCDGTTMVYSLYHRDAKYGSVAAVPGDPRCKTG